MRRFEKCRGLTDAVLTGGSVDDQQRFVRGAWQLLFDNAPHLRQLLHQVRLVVQTSGGVDEHDVGAPRFGGGDCVVSDRAGIGSGLVLDHIDADAIRPQL